MSFHHKGIEYFLGQYAVKKDISKFTISIPTFKNFFKEIEVEKESTAHSKARDLINEELQRISNEQKYNGRK